MAPVITCRCMRWATRWTFSPAIRTSTRAVSRPASSTWPSAARAAGRHPLQPELCPQRRLRTQARVRIDYKATATACSCSHGTGRRRYRASAQRHYIGNWTLPTGETSVAVTFAHNIPGGKHGAQADFDRCARMRRPPTTLAPERQHGARVAGDCQWRALVMRKSRRTRWCRRAVRRRRSPRPYGLCRARGIERFGRQPEPGMVHAELVRPALGYQCRALAFMTRPGCAATMRCLEKARRKASAAVASACVCC